MSESYQDIAEVGMGGIAIQKLLDEIDLETLINELSEEAETLRANARRSL